MSHPLPGVRSVLLLGAEGCFLVGAFEGVLRRRMLTMLMIMRNLLIMLGMLMIVLHLLHILVILDMLLFFSCS